LIELDQLECEEKADDYDLVDKENKMIIFYQKFEIDLVDSENEDEKGKENDLVDEDVDKDG